MKNISIKAKLTLLSTILMSIIVVIVLTIITYMSGSFIDTNSKNTLQDVVDDTLNLIENQNDDIDDNEEDDFENENEEDKYEEDKEDLDNNEEYNLDNGEEYEDSTDEEDTENENDAEAYEDANSEVYENDENDELDNDDNEEDEVERERSINNTSVSRLSNRRTIINEPVLDLNKINLLSKGVIVTIYDKDLNIIESGSTRNIEADIPFNDKVIEEVTVNSSNYYVYDRKYADELWVRGIISVDETGQIMDSLTRLSFWILPIFIIISGVGSYFISRRALAPINKIIDTSKDIMNSEDLSLRINLGNGKDEIHKLSHAFDEMFESIEASFNTEKQFSSDVSHELRTPTAVILAQCEYSLGKGATNEDKAEALEVIQRQTRKMSSLISNLLRLTRLDRGIEKIKKTNLNFSDLLEEICEDQEFAYERKVKTDISKNIKIYGDAEMLEILIRNLITNAFKYSDIEIEVSLKKSKENIVLKVKDYGVGISEENIKNIFKRFYQVDSSRTSKDGSMGLGLSMVATIAKLHNAKINVNSEIESYSEFEIIFNNSL